MKRYFILFGLSSLLFACGQKGALYLPKKTDKPQQEQTTNQEQGNGKSLDDTRTKSAD